MKPKIIKLTKEQMATLEDFFIEIYKASGKNRPCAILAQIAEWGEMKISIVPHKKALKIQEVLKRKVGERLNYEKWEKYR